MLIGVSGKKRSGKDTAGKYLTDVHNFARKAFADSLKALVSKMYNIDIKWFHDDYRKEFGLRHLPVTEESKELVPIDDFYKSEDGTLYHTPRTLCMIEGVFKRKVDPLYWCKQVVDGGDFSVDNIVITDVRFKNEAEYIKSKGGILLRINRTQGPSLLSTHQSETDLDDYQFDYVIQNDGNKSALYDKLDAYIESKQKGE